MVWALFQQQSYHCTWSKLHDIKISQSCHILRFLSFFFLQTHFDHKRAPAMWFRVVGSWVIPMLGDGQFENTPQDRICGTKVTISVSSTYEVIYLQVWLTRRWCDAWLKESPEVLSLILSWLPWQHNHQIGAMTFIMNNVKCGNPFGPVKFFFCTAQPYRGHY